MRVYTYCRTEFVEAVSKVFGTSDRFLDFIEDDRCSIDYDCFMADSGECYIINRNTGEYINWYKTNHLGRDIHTNVNPNNFIDFLQKFRRGLYDD